MEIPLKTYDFTKKDNNVDDILIDNHMFNTYVSQIEFKNQTECINDITGNMYNEFANLKLNYQEICSKHDILANVYKKLVVKLQKIEKRLIKLEQTDKLTKEMTNLTFDMPLE